MKKSTLEAIRNLLNGETVDMETLRTEINDEWERLTEKSRTNATLYETAAPIVLRAMSATPQTTKEIFAACSSELPEGFTANKVSYLLLHQLSDKVMKHENGKNPNTYSVR